MKLPALSCLFDHLIGEIEQDQAVGDEGISGRGFRRKSPENMADNDAKVDEEVRHIAKVSVCLKEHTCVFRAEHETVVNPARG